MKEMTTAPHSQTRDSETTASETTAWETRAREQFEAMLLNVGLAWKAEQEKLTRSIQSGAREQFASTMNLGLRRLRTVSSVAEAAALTVELASTAADKLAFFLFRDGTARAEVLRNMGHQPIEFSPNQGAAFQTAVDTQDPVVAMATPPEVSPPLAERLGTENLERVFLYPLSVRGAVKAVLLAAGNVQPATLELIAGIAALQMETLTPVAPSTSMGATGLIGIS